MKDYVQCVSELQRKRLDLENAITIKVNELVKQFQDETGVSVSGVYIDTYDISSIGEPRDSILGQTKILLNI